MLKKNILYVLFLFVLASVIYYALFSTFIMMDAEDNLPGNDSPLFILGIAIPTAAGVIAGSLILTFIVSLFFWKSKEIRQRFYAKRFKPVFTICWLFFFLLTMFAGISS